MPKIVERLGCGLNGARWYWKLKDVSLESVSSASSSTFRLGSKVGVLRKSFVDVLSFLRFSEAYNPRLIN